MKVLWFTNTPASYKRQKHGYNGGGWIISAQNQLEKHPDIELAISFLLSDEPFKVVGENVVYYPIPSIKKSSFFHSIKKEKKIWPLYKESLLKVVNDFQPDIIHIWGSENIFALLGDCVDLPIVLHIQGILNPLRNAFLPPSVSWSSLFLSKFSFSIAGIKNLLRSIRDKNSCKINSYREEYACKNIYHYMGRTDWDKRVSFILNPQSSYYYCSEYLRDIFYERHERHIPEKLKIVSTISTPLYKGADLILKTAQILKNKLCVDFEWDVYGIHECVSSERITGISSKDVNVNLKGIVDSTDLVEAELNCTCYVHPSYIDNSPNSLCEAQILGITCVATNVGGIPSLIINGKTGFLIPANDPYQLAYVIFSVHKDSNLNKEVGNNARECALLRHNKETITNNIISIYESIIGVNKLTK